MALHIFEIILFALANFVPYLLLTIYTFKNKTRFPKGITALFCIGATLVQILTRMWSAFSDSPHNTMVNLIRLVCYMLLSAAAIKVHLGKLLFIQLIIANTSSLISVTALGIESILFSNQMHRMYCWHATLIMIVLHLIITYPFSLFTKDKLKPLIESPPVEKEWNTFWLVPLAFHLMIQYQIYGTSTSSEDFITQPQNIVYLLLANVCAYFIYYLIIEFSFQLRKNLELEQQNHVLDIERLEYQTLHERMEKTRIARHDIRHHITIMSDYLESKEYDKLKEYLDSYNKSIPDTGSYIFCSNRVVNRLLLFFATQAYNNNIDFQAKLSIPENIPIPEIDISVLLGNLLENALEACLEQKNTDRKIIISGKGDSHSLIFTIDNTYENEIRKNRNGEFLTTKSYGNGIGMQSAKNIVARYNGVFEAKTDGKMFYVSFMMNF